MSLGQATATQPAPRGNAGILRTLSLPDSAPHHERHLEPSHFRSHRLNRLFGLYGRKVAAGEWRDYAIDFLKDRAVFSVFAA